MVDNIKNKFKDYKPYINGAQKMNKASVLIPLVKQSGVHHILFEVRSKNLNTQPNEIAFPGGKIDPGETPLNAAIRETCEELGTDKSNVEIISPLDLLVTPMDLIIHPYLGIIHDLKQLSINEDEVDHIFLVPIKHLLENKATIYDNQIKIIPNNDFPYDIIPNKSNYKFGSGNYPVFFYSYKDYIIWGITAKILENFLNFLKS